MAGPTFCAVCGGEKDAEKASQPCWVTYLLIVCWYLFFPFILVYYSIKKFLVRLPTSSRICFIITSWRFDSFQCFQVPCILEYIFTIFSVFCFKCSSLMCTFCCSDMRHKDRYFPPAPKSLGGKFEKSKCFPWTVRPSWATWPHNTDCNKWIQWISPGHALRGYIWTTNTNGCPGYPWDPWVSTHVIDVHGFGGYA